MKRILALVILLALVSSSIGSAAAQERKKSGGVTITPALQQLVIGGDQASQDGSFTVQNDSDQTATFELSTIDMGALDDTGGLIFSGLPQDYQKKHGLANWVELPQTKLDIAAGKVATVSFTIKNNTSLTPGGHYGAIIVKHVLPQGTVSDTQVSLSPQAASLLFLLKRGGEIYQLSLQEIKTNHSAWSLPTKVELPFKNEGNVHVVPRGIVMVKDMQGREIARGIINPESSTVLPERTRTLQVSFNELPKVVWPGRYTVEVVYRYDGQESISTFTQPFYTANLRILVLLAVVVVASLLLVYKLRKQIRIAISGLLRLFGRHKHRKIK